MSATPTYEMRPVAWVRGGRTVPRDDDWDAEQAWIVLDDAMDPQTLLGLDAFSHVEVVFVFDRVDPDTVETVARRPRNNPDWPRVGVFAQRGKSRPNRIGVTRCRLDEVDLAGRRIHVRGLDAVDGTPVLDLKPHMPAFDARGEVRQPDWAAELMAGYWA